MVVFQLLDTFPDLESFVEKQIHNIRMLQFQSNPVFV